MGIFDRILGRSAQAPMQHAPKLESGQAGHEAGRVRLDLTLQGPTIEGLVTLSGTTTFGKAAMSPLLARHPTRPRHDPAQRSAPAGTGQPGRPQRRSCPGRRATNRLLTEPPGQAHRVVRRGRGGNATTSVLPSRHRNGSSSRISGGWNDGRVTAIRPTGDPPTTGEWSVILAAPTTPVNELARAQMPDNAGVYLWRREGRAVYVGMATSLRGRAWGKHLGAGVSLAGSSLRRNVCELLFGIPPNITGRPAKQKVTIEQATAIHDWLLGCELSWQSCATVLEADQLERRLRAAYLPPLNRV